MSALQQKSLPGVCLWCGQQLDKVRSDARYCSPAHKQAHYRWRRRFDAYHVKAAAAVDQLIAYGQLGCSEDAVKALEDLQAQVKHGLRLLRVHS